MHESVSCLCVDIAVAHPPFSHTLSSSPIPCLSDPLFTLFTSGSTGKPKGLVHSTGGFLVYAAVTAHYAFDLKDSDVFACGADIGWITGHSYVVYGPLCLGATTLLYEGHPSYPHAGRYWEVVAKHRISIFYTSPTAVRSLMAVGDEEKNIAAWDRSSLRILGSVGEPINPAAWDWFHKHVGDRRAPIVDTYWRQFFILFFCSCFSIDIARCLAEWIRSEWSKGSRS